jgi:hypothetical protein
MFLKFSKKTEYASFTTIVRIQNPISHGVCLTGVEKVIFGRKYMQKSQRLKGLVLRVGVSIARFKQPAN